MIPLVAVANLAPQVDAINRFLEESGSRVSVYVTSPEDRESIDLVANDGESETTLTTFTSLGGFTGFLDALAVVLGALIDTTEQKETA